MTAALVLGTIACVLAWGVTGRVLAVVRRRGVLATPNERSSHTRPTPTGGGAGIAAAVVLALVAGRTAGLGDDVAVVVAAVGLSCWCGVRDDLRPLPPLVKMGVLTLVAVALTLAHRVAAVEVPLVGGLRLAWLAWPLTLLWLAGFTNAFNFMDGIDGIASLTAIVSGAVYAVAGLVSDDATLAMLGAVTAGATLGFLPWNFPKARMFMGDAGSLPLGLLLAYCAVLAHASGAIPFPASVLLLGPFIFDSAFTLLRRAARGERVWEAHREHIYQRLSRIWDSHPKVSLLYAAFSLVTGALALLYRDLEPAGRLLSLGVPLAAMLAFAASVLAADRRGQTRTATVPDAADGAHPEP